MRLFYQIFRKGPLKGWLISARWLFEPRDIWVGVYWKRYPAGLDLFVCMLPLIPVNVYVQYMVSGSSPQQKLNDN